MTITFILNCYYYKKGFNSSEKNIVYIKQFDDAIKFIVSNYKDIHEVKKIYFIFFLEILKFFKFRNWFHLIILNYYPIK